MGSEKVRLIAHSLRLTEALLPILRRSAPSAK